MDVKRYNFTSSEVARNAIELIKKLDSKNVMLYLPMSGEADVTGVTVLPLNFYVPVTHATKIKPAVYRPNAELMRGEFGVSIPAEPEFADDRCIDIVFVPAVALDRNKNRLGYGKGCYDRFLADVNCVKAAVGFDFQLVDRLETGPYDVKMDYIITESGYF